MERYPEASIYNAMCNREWNTPIGLTDAFGGDFLIRADAFSLVGGFAEEQVAHEEPELCGRLRRAGFKICRIDEDMTIHDAGIFHLSQFYKRNRRAGFGIAQALIRSGLQIDPGGAAILRRSLLWSIIPPLSALSACLILGPLGIALLAAYPAQIVRQALQNKQKAGGTIPNRIKVATLSMVGKFGEAQGAMEFYVKKTFGKPAKPIYYR
jgi:hypothetical protein